MPKSKHKLLGESVSTSFDKLNVPTEFYKTEN